MDTQQVAALILFLFISLMMFYGFLHLEKTLSLLKKIYGIFGVNLDFTQRGEKLVRGILLILSLIFLATSIALVFF